MNKKIVSFISYSTACFKYPQCPLTPQRTLTFWVKNIGQIVFWLFCHQRCSFSTGIFSPQLPIEELVHRYDLLLKSCAWYQFRVHNRFTVRHAYVEFAILLMEIVCVGNISPELQPLFHDLWPCDLDLGCEKENQSNTELKPNSDFDIIWIGNIYTLVCIRCDKTFIYETKDLS
jgi:hypothetical protein